MLLVRELAGLSTGATSFLSASLPLSADAGPTRVLAMLNGESNKSNFSKYSKKRAEARFFEYFEKFDLFFHAGPPTGPT